MVSEDAERRPRIVLVVRSVVVNPEGKILLMRRTRDELYAPGFWEIPGGKLDAGKDVAHAMEDEVLEESGLAVRPINKLFYVDSQIISEGRYQGLPYVLIVGVSKYFGGSLKLSNEHDAFVWAEYPDQALGYEIKHDVKRALVVLGEQINAAKQEEG